MFVSRRGELSLRVEAFALLAKSLRPPPEKHHGLTDVETRFRHRELDLIANEEVRELFVDARARSISAVRAVPRRRRLRRGRDPGAAAAVRRRRGAPVHHPPQRARPRPLPADRHRAVPEALIVGGLERVYELGKDFRNEGVDTKHNPEFTMLELYEAYADYHDVAGALRARSSPMRRPPTIGYAGEIDFTPPWRRETLRDAILRRAPGSTSWRIATARRCAAAMRAAG